MQPNVIKSAVVAAGGRLATAEKLNVSPWAISYWQRDVRALPLEFVRPLSRLSKGAVSVNDILAAAESQAEAKKAAA